MNGLKNKYFLSKYSSIWLSLLLVVASQNNFAVDKANSSSLPIFYLDQDIEISLALAAGPEGIREGASVYVFTPSGYKEVVKGNNGFTCFVNRDGLQNGDTTLRPTCWDQEGSDSIVPVMLRVGKLISEGKSADYIKSEIKTAYKQNKFRQPKRNGIAYMLKGDMVFDLEKNTIASTVFPPHYMLYAPGLKNSDIGISDQDLKNNPSLPFVYSGYSGGENNAYIIILASKENTSHH